MTGSKVWLSTLRWSLLRPSFWGMTCVFLVLGRTFSGAWSEPHDAVGSFARGYWYFLAFVFSLPGCAVGLLALEAFRGTLVGGGRDRISCRVAILSAPGVAFGVACLPMGFGAPPLPPLISLIELGLASLTALTWGLTCGSVVSGSRGAMLGFLAGPCIARLFPPSPSVVIGGHPLTPWLLPMLGLMLALWLLEPPRTSTR